MDIKTATLIPAFNRYDHFVKVATECIRQDFPSIHVLLDGPKTQEDVRVQSLILAKCEELELVVIGRKENIGLAKNITSGISFILHRFDQVIIIEDDCVPRDDSKQWFLSSLEKYRDTMSIGGICGYMPFTGDLISKEENLILKRFVPWGWATWRNRWEGFKLDILNELDTELITSTRILGEDVYGYLTLDSFKQNKMDIWSLSFIIHCHINSWSFVYPDINMIDNIGFDGTGVHSTETSVFSEVKRIDSLSSESVDQALIGFMEKSSKMMYFLKERDNV